MNSIEITLSDLAVGKHRIQEATAYASYVELSAEEDVGFYGSIEITGLTGLRGHSLKRLVRAISPKDWARIEEQVAEAVYFC